VETKRGSRREAAGKEKWGEKGADPKRFLKTELGFMKTEKRALESISGRGYKKKQSFLVGRKTAYRIY